MIKRYRVGEPLPTGATVKELEITGGIMPEWELTEGHRIACSDFNKNTVTVYSEEVRLNYRMGDDCRVYGLGETVRGLNKRGWLYVSDNADDPLHTGGKHSLYASHNFFIITTDASCHGIFVDTPGRVEFDIGYTDARNFTIRLSYGSADIYRIDGSDELEIVRGLRELTGAPYIPPMWAFGFGQSRWSYKTPEEVREVADKHRDAGVPLDMIYLDIDYMERFKDFTINREAFPDFEGLVVEMRERGIRLIPIIDAGVKIEDGYDVYEEGVEKGYFCKAEDGEPFVSAVWPGRSHFPDFLNSKAREWFGDKYSRLIDIGIEGFWNDMNEPAIFYSEKRLGEAFARLDEYREMNLDIHTYFEMLGVINGLANSAEDYASFYHDMDGLRVSHNRVHNIYGAYMTRAAGEAFRRNYPDRKFLLFARSSYIGAHRYGGIWLGDNHSWWEHIRLVVRQLPGVNMAGFLYSGPDTGGFGSECTEDLLMRWLELSVFIPLLRDHYAQDTREQEFYRFGRAEDFRNIIRLRYALIPYLYEVFSEAARGGGMYFKPLAFEYRGDKRACAVEDQLLIGDDIMIAPVCEQNAEGRYVYLPEAMKLYRFRNESDYDVEDMEAGDHYVSLALNELAMFVRPGRSFYLVESKERVGELDCEDRRVFDFC